MWVLHTVPEVDLSLLLETWKLQSMKQRRMLGTAETINVADAERTRRCVSTTESDETPDMIPIWMVFIAMLSLHSRDGADLSFSVSDSANSEVALIRLCP
jgi:hypothetical protein